jgi:lysophospholipase L1-like esterase
LPLSRIALARTAVFAARMDAKFRTLLLLVLSLALGIAPLAAAPERWAAEIAKLTAKDASAPPPAHGVVFVGSSSIRLWTTLATDFPNIATINRGFGGSELADSVFYIDRVVLPYRPRTVVLFAGTNDIWAGKTPETVAADFRAFRTKLHAALPETRLIYLSLTYAPSRARAHDAVRATNRLIAEECAKDPRCTFVDVSTPLFAANGQLRPELYVEDQLHMNASGYAIWTKVLAPYLQP